MFNGNSPHANISHGLSWYHESAEACLYYPSSEIARYSNRVTEWTPSDGAGSLEHWQWVGTKVGLQTLKSLKRLDPYILLLALIRGPRLLYVYWYYSLIGSNGILKTELRNKQTNTGSVLCAIRELGAGIRETGYSLCYHLPVTFPCNEETLRSAPPGSQEL
ncbi:hypothetical protein L873DRAFT_1844015 [Choiromyces venosus 120613-1]|uniref:Uncharacterized protein n=1 Tax=Choiromyces venosus 120613-1 TaxID=1336337 RepID=A0A3N4JK95_9PEZI|nr:hypothetical protein L873DRAFT_1844015 [Choiromyces venosus 120613-1]